MTGKPMDPNAAKAPELALAVLNAIQDTGSIVGQKVTRVPSTVRPTQPSRLAMVWASSSRPCQGSSGTRARVAPSEAPTARLAAAAR